MSRVRMLHFLKDWWKFIQIHQYLYYMALSFKTLKSVLSSCFSHFFPHNFLVLNVSPPPPFLHPTHTSTICHTKYKIQSVRTKNNMLYRLINCYMCIICCPCGRYSYTAYFAYFLFLFLGLMKYLWLTHISTYEGKKHTQENKENGPCLALWLILFDLQSCNMWVWHYRQSWLCISTVLPTCMHARVGYNQDSVG